MSDVTPVALARTVARALELRPELLVTHATTDPALAEALGSLASSAGARLDPEASFAEAGFVVVDEVTPEALEREVRALTQRVRPGGRVVVAVRGGPGGLSIEAFAEQHRPLFDLARAHGQLADGVAVVSGPRRTPPEPEAVKRLRGVGHDLEPTVLIGRAGLTPELVAAARTALERHGILKARLTPQSDLDKDAAARRLAAATGGYLVHRVGKMMLIVRPDVPLDPPVFKRRRH